MANKEEVIVKIGTDVANAQKDLESVKKGVQDIGKATEDGTKATKGMANGLKGIGLAIKAAGIGLLLKGLSMLADIFMRNQKVADLFNTSFEFVSIAMNDFVNFIINNTGGVVDFFKSIFENPQQSLKDFGKLIKENIIERFNSALEVAGFMADAFKKIFEGDFKGALNSVKEAGKEMVDVYTGVDGTVGKVRDTINKTVESVTDYATETFKAAQNNIKLEKTAKLAQVQIQGLIEKYDREAEIQRQLRDDTSKTFAERIKANEKLGKILEKQQKEMLRLAQVEKDRAQAQFDKLKNDENEVALEEAKNELAAIRAQITGFQSEQLKNQVSLERELKDVKKEIFLEGLDERQREIAETNAHYDQLVEMAKKAGEDITVIEEARSKALTKIHEAEQQAKLQAFSNVAGQIADVAGRETAFGKAAAVAQATINAYQGASKAIATLPPPFGAITAVLTAAQGFDQVKKILAVTPPEANFAAGGMVNGFGTGTSDSINARLSKGESVINARSTRMFRPVLSAINEAGGGRGFADGGTLDEGLGGITTGTVKAYVVSDEMTNNQERLAKIRRKATI